MCIRRGNQGHESRLRSKKCFESQFWLSLSLSLIYEIKWYSWRNNMTALPLAAYFLTWKRTYNCRKRRTEQANANDTLVCLSSTALRMLFALGIRLGAY